LVGAGKIPNTLARKIATGEMHNMRTRRSETTGATGMYKRLDRARRTIPLVVGMLTLISVGALLLRDVAPQAFPTRAHDVLAAFPLAMIAIAYLLYQNARRPVAKEFVKAIMLAAAFLFWAANQFWPDSRHATLFNDIAIALFVLDVFLVIIGWPRTSPDESFAETYSKGPTKD
jgi:hypothetical protein